MAFRNVSGKIHPANMGCHIIIDYDEYIRKAYAAETRSMKPYDLFTY
jgi:hypothetical protein